MSHVPLRKAFMKRSRPRKPEQCHHRRLSSENTCWARDSRGCDARGVVGDGLMK